MYECFHCGERAVIWDGDFSFEDYCEEGEGIIHECHCENCGAQITYRIPLDQEEEKAKDDRVCDCGVCMYKGSEEYKCENCMHYTEKRDEEDQR